MRRLLAPFLAVALLAPPAVAFAHDPLEDESGEEDLTPKADAQPTSHRKERQEAEMAKEVQEREEADFHMNQEKEEFLRDRAETREVVAGQRRRSQLSSSGGSRPHRDTVAPAPAPRHDTATPAAAPAKSSNEDKTERGDVDPTDPSAGDGAKKSGSDDDDSAPKPKKKHSDDD